jgi:CRISPR/Cas system-associated endonuclease Cas3-HD
LKGLLEFLSEIDFDRFSKPGNFMAISVTNQGDKTLVDTKKLKKVDQDAQKIKENIQKNVSDIDKTLENFGEKSAKLMCLLRLDMVADKLDKINSRLAKQIDEITDAFEKEVI